MVPEGSELNPIDYAPPEIEPQRLNALLVAAAIVGLCGTSAAAAITFATLWPVPRGTPIRPMALAFFVFLIAAATLSIGILLLVTGIVGGPRDWRSVVLAVLAIALSLAPLPASSLVTEGIVTVHSLVLEP